MVKENHMVEIGFMVKYDVIIRHVPCDVLFSMSPMSFMVAEKVTVL